MQPQAANRVDDGLAVVRQMVDQVRGLAPDLRPSLLDDFGLAAAPAAGRQAHPAVDLDAPAPGPGLPAEVAAAYYRIPQETITNAARHAGRELAGRGDRHPCLDGELASILEAMPAAPPARCRGGPVRDARPASRIVRIPAAPILPTLVSCPRASGM